MEVFLDYTLYRNLLNDDFCDKVAESFKDNSIYAPHEVGDWHRINKGSLYTEILENFSPVIPHNFTVKQIHVSEYNKGDSLSNHRDPKSSLTIVSEISSAVRGGRFIINKDTYIELNKGDVVTLNGGTSWHGVETIEEGSRLSLNIWMQLNRGLL